MPPKRTLRQYKHDPTRPAYYTARGMSHREAIKAAQGESKQPRRPGLGYARSPPGTKTPPAQRRAAPANVTGTGKTMRARGVTLQPEPTLRRPRKVRQTADQNDVTAVLRKPKPPP